MRELRSISSIRFLTSRCNSAGKNRVDKLNACWDSGWLFPLYQETVEEIIHGIEGYQPPLEQQ